MNDIVDRLRAYNPIHGALDWRETMTEAANEIERLRELVEELTDDR